MPETSPFNPAFWKFYLSTWRSSPTALVLMVILATKYMGTVYGNGQHLEFSLTVLVCFHEDISPLVLYKLSTGFACNTAEVGKLFL